jgi:hypothetical protein
LAEHYSAQSWEDLTRWLELVDASVYASMPGQAVRLLEGAAALSRLTVVEAERLLSTLDRLFEIAENLFESPYGARIHECWLRICTKLPDRLADHCETCVYMEPPRLEWAVEAFVKLLDTQDHAQIPRLLRSCSRKMTPGDMTGALSSTAQLYGILTSLLIDAPEDEKAFMDALWKAIKPERSVVHADMFVGVLRVWKKRENVNPRWLTPLEKEVKALCLARRFDEASRLAGMRKGLLIRPRRIPAADFVARQREQYTDQRLCHRQRDYEIITEICFQELAPPKLVG